MRIESVLAAGLIALAAANAASAAEPDGGKLFQEQCSVCHQPNAQGLPGQFPPLAGNGDLFLSREFPANVVLFGLTGKIEVKGKTVDGVMPPLGELLADAQIAAVLNYVRSHFGNEALKPADLKPLDAPAVAAVRATKLSSAQVHAVRDKLRGAAKR